MKLSGEWELAPEEISALFEVKGWCYHTTEGLIIPSTVTIEGMLAKLIRECLASGKDKIQGARFLIWKDPELPNSYDLWLNLGYIWDEDALTDEEREILEASGEDEEGE